MQYLYPASPELRERVPKLFARTTDMLDARVLLDARRRGQPAAAPAPRRGAVEEARLFKAEQAGASLPVLRRQGVLQLWYHFGDLSNDGDFSGGHGYIFAEGQHPNHKDGIFVHADELTGIEGLAFGARLEYTLAVNPDNGKTKAIEVARPGECPRTGDSPRRSLSPQQEPLPPRSLSPQQQQRRSSYVILRGLPFDASEEHIACWFASAPGGHIDVLRVLLTFRQGPHGWRRSGEAVRRAPAT